MRKTWRRLKHQKVNSSEDVAEGNIHAVAQLEAATRIQCSPADRIADAVTRFCGSYTFLWFHVFFFAGWILCNVYFPKRWRFDAYPFEFLTFVVSLEAIFLSTFILISQNREAKITERRAHLDLQVNLLAEQETTKMLQLLKQIATKVGVDLRDDPHLKALARKTDPEKLAEKIEGVMTQYDHGYTDSKPASACQKTSEPKI